MTITLYPAIVHDNSLSLDHGGSEVDEACEQIYNATKGWGVSNGRCCCCHACSLFLCVFCYTTSHSFLENTKIVNLPTLSILFSNFISI